VGSVNQLRFDDKHGEVSFFGQKMIILRRDVFRVMRDGLERLVGDQAAPFLSFLASGVGIHEGSIFRDSIQGASDKEKRASLENLVHTALEDTNLGLGKVCISGLDFDRGSAKVAIVNCFEALENGSSEQPNCMFTSGFLAGVFAEVLDKTVQASEVKCISQGEAECEFQINPTSETQGVEPSTGETGKEATAEGEPNTLAKPSVATQAEHPSESKPAEKVLTDGTGFDSAKSANANQVDYDTGVERASRIAKRKQRFWDRLFK